MSCVESVTVHPRSVTIRTGDWYYDTRAEVYPPDADCTDVEWYSDNYNIASVGASSGYIHGLTPGTTRIYAEATDGSGISDYITVTVQNYIEVESVTLNRTNITLEKGDCFPLMATVCPGNATKPGVSWRSTNTSVATVSNGVVKAKGHGSASIYADATDGSGVSASCRVCVTEDILVSSVTVKPSSKTMRVGTSDFLHATVYPKDATDKCVVWTSSNPGVATVIFNSGLVLAHRVGQTTIRATPRDGGADPGECVLTVEPAIPVEGVSLYPQSLTMSVGDTERIDVCISPSNAKDKRVTWSSSDESVASVDCYTGVVTAKNKGIVTITAKSVSGNKTGTCTITVDSWQKVIVERDGNSNYSRIVFKNGKVWNCINEDVINDYSLDRDDPLTHRFYENVYKTKVIVEGLAFPHYSKPLKEYTNEEIKLIYTIDPLGLAGYVETYAREKFVEGDNIQESLKDVINYKDDIFYLLFNRHPRYYRRNITGSWNETTDKTPLRAVLSESEFLFGWHAIYDGFTLVEFLSAVADIVSLLMLCPAFKALSPISMLNKFLSFCSLTRAVAESALNEDFLGFVTAIASGQIDEDNLDSDDFIVDAAYKTRNYSMCWAIGLLNVVSLCDSLNALADTFNSGPHFYKEIFTMCENDIKYDIVIRTTDGKLVPLSAINSVIQ